MVLISKSLDGSYCVEVKGIEYTLCGGMLLSTAIKYIARLCNTHNASIADECRDLYNQMVYTKTRQSLDLALSFNLA